MQKTLYLIRHAKSDWSVPGQKDMERELNSRGISDAPRMGAKMKELGMQPELMISSPSVRTRMTLEFMTEQMDYDFEAVHWEEDIYESSVRTLLRIINELPEEKQRVAIVGHNPGLTYLAEYITGDILGNIPTCGIVEIQLENLKWEEVSQNTGSLKQFIFPKKDL
jgi:phosphohistidine phosphatase